MPNKIDTSYLKKFRKLILQLLKKGYQIVLVVGGGGVNRQYVEAIKKVARPKDIDLDLLGIAATKLNAELVRVAFSDWAHKEVIADPVKKLKTNKKLIIASGWLPGCSTDKDAVLWAKNLGAKTVINLSDIAYVYDKDPDKYKDAKPLHELSWADYLRIVGSKWTPRLSSPFDPIAAQLARKNKTKVVILNGRNLANISAYLADKPFKGTIIS